MSTCEARSAIGVFEMDLNHVDVEVQDNRRVGVDKVRNIYHHTSIVTGVSLTENPESKSYHIFELFVIISISLWCKIHILL